MNVAVLIPKLDGGSRATNIQRVLALVDCAAQAVPAPEIVVVPRGCDASRGDRRIRTSGMAATYFASLCAKAREWGVLIVAACERFSEIGVTPTAVVIDADGDERVAQESCDEKVFVGWADTIIGRVGVGFAPSGVDSMSEMLPDEPTPDLMILFGTGGEDRCAKAAEAWGAPVCLIETDDDTGRVALATSDPDLVTKTIDLDVGCVTIVQISVTCMKTRSKGDSTRGADTPVGS